MRNTDIIRYNRTQNLIVQMYEYLKVAVARCIIQEITVYCQISYVCLFLVIHQLYL